MKNTEKGIGKEAIRESRKLKLKIFMKNKLALKEFCFVHVLSNIVHRKN